MSEMKTCRCGREFQRITWYKHNHSAFERPKYGYHPSQYSKVICIKCGKNWMSKAKYLDDWENPVHLLKKGEHYMLKDLSACCVKDPY